MTDKYGIETDPTRPLDDCERWLEEEYFPKILPSFPPFERVDRNTAVTFEDRLGVRCTIGAGEIAAAFLALVDNGLLPPVADTWRALIPEDLMPEVMLNRPTPSTSGIRPHQRSSTLERPVTTPIYMVLEGFLTDPASNGVSTDDA